ncbi:MAG TPA: Gfo/Idh/MocA family oxidoreductase [Vicinamibacterales bacterium]|nr:Gfo/Idh/MocA family oxidoreductase [Vicinamibacterales bacterium]
MAKSSSRRIRYGVVGLGHIAQVAVLPAFRHAERNSELVALVSDDARKRRLVGRKYKVDTFGYDDYDACLQWLDAVYIALPNSMHAEYTIRAARAGVHVLCEKPMAVTVAECESMIAACRRNRVKLMIAYRLHFDDLTLRVIDLVRKGHIGDARFFNSSFGLTVRRGNIRTEPKLGGGTLYDIGVYCINAARHLFASEPTEVMAISVNSGAANVKKIDESTGALLRFEDDRVAAFVTSFNSTDVSAYRIVGTRGDISVDPGYEYAEGLACEVTINGRTTRVRTGKHDQFAPELLYFSDCVLKNREPEPSGEEGLQDVRIVQALYRSADTGRAVAIPKYRPKKQPTLRQRIIRPGIPKPSIVAAQSGSR